MTEDTTLNPESLSAAEKYWLAQAVTGMLAADGRLDPPERQYFSEVLKWMESKEQTQKLMGLVKMREAPEWPKLSLTQEQAIPLLKYLTRAMVANQRVTGAEMALFRRAADWLGVSNGALKKVFLYAQDCWEGGQPSLAVITSTEYTVVPLRELTRRDCAFSFHRAIMSGAFLTIQLGRIARDLEFYPPLFANVSAVSRDSLNKERFLIRVEFQQPPDTRHGVLQFLEPKRYKEKEFPSGFGYLKTENRSLQGQSVACYACGEKKLPFWTLRPHTMKIEPNIFGVPFYREAYPTYKFCDFTKLEITVCPRCFFSSHRLVDFQQHPDDSPSFNKEAFQEIWRECCPELKKTINELPKNFGSEPRTPEQTLLSFEIAVETHEALKLAGNPKDHLWETAVLYLKQAELRINNNQREAAEKNLLTVENLLEPMQKHFEGDRPVQTLILLYLIRTYFRNYSGADECRQLLYQYGETPDITSPHNRILKEANTIMSFVKERRQKLNRKTLTNFRLPELKRNLI